MSDIKQFTTAAERASGEREGEILVELDGVELKIYQPDPAQYAMLLAAIGRGSSEVEKIAGTLNFFVKIMDRSSAAHIEARLLDWDDPFGLEDVENMIEWLTEEWSGRPTQASSDSTPSPQNTGPESTQHSLLSN